MQFLRKIWPIQLAFFLCSVCRICLSSLTLCSISSFPTWPVQLTEMQYEYKFSLLVIILQYKQHNSVQNCYLNMYSSVQ